MKFKDIIQDILNEEYNQDNKSLYGYHVTLNNPQTINSIRNNGFTIGGGDMEGKGFYSFYDLNRACGYSSKEYRTNTVIKFEITDINKLLILDMDIAKEVFGEQYHIVNQFERCFPNGIDDTYNDYLSVYGPTRTKEEYIQELYKLEEAGYQSIGFEIFTLHSMNFQDNINVLSYGQYGMQFRLNDTSITKPVGVYELEPFTTNITNFTPWN